MSHKLLYVLFSMVLPLFLLCSCDEGNELPGNIEFKASTSQADIGDTVTFSVFYDGVDVTLDSRIFSDNGITVDGNEWIPSEAGKYIFKAEYNSVESGSEVITVNEGPVEAVKCDHKVVLHKFTQTTCPNCPNFTSTLSLLEEVFGDSLVVISVHAQDPFSNSYGNKLIDAAADVAAYGGYTWGYPAGWVSMRDLFVAPGYNAVYDSIRSSIDNYKPSCSIGISSYYESKKVYAQSEIKIRESGEYKICAFMTEDNVYCEQPCTEPSKIYNNVLRRCATEALGDNLGSLEPGTISKDFEFTTLSSYNIDNCKVIVYVLKKYGQSYYINNAEICAVGNTIKVE